MYEEKCVISHIIRRYSMHTAMKLTDNRFEVECEASINGYFRAGPEVVLKPEFGIPVTLRKRVQ